MMDATALRIEAGIIALIAETEGKRAAHRKANRAARVTECGVRIQALEDALAIVRPPKMPMAKAA